MPNFRKILAPVDFAGEGERVDVSAATRRAVELAALLVSEGGALRLFHATPALPSATTFAGPAGLPPDVLAQIHARAEAATREVLEALRKEVCPDLQPQMVARPGDPLHLVLDEASQWGADLIVLAASGRSRVSRFFLGSTADRVIREASCPVLVVPADRDV